MDRSGLRDSRLLSSVELEFLNLMTNSNYLLLKDKFILLATFCQSGSHLCLVSCIVFTLRNVFTVCSFILF
jgi:hypothetical protein